MHNDSDEKAKNINNTQFLQSPNKSLRKKSRSMFNQ